MSDPVATSDLTVGIIQSNYIPWKGYFDIINDVDLFVFHDDVQYTKNDWRNRNRIKTGQGVRWLTIPVGTDEARLISDVRLDDPSWARAHWRRLVDSYGKAPYFGVYRDLFAHVYLGRRWRSLSELNQSLIRIIAVDLLGTQTRFEDSSGYALRSRKSDRVVELLSRCGATRYVSGPAARGYLDEMRLRDEGIELVWKDYTDYPEYAQLHPPFCHEVSVLDLLFHLGPDAPYYIWGWRQDRAADMRQARAA